MVDRLGVRMKNNIRIEIQKRINKLKPIENYDFFGAFLYGSQNYNLDTEKSDIDLVILYIPTAEKLINLTPPLSKEEILTQTNEKNVLKDIRLFIKELLKGSPNALEILNTNNYLVDIKYYDLWSSLKANIDGFMWRKLGSFLNAELGIMYNALNKNFTKKAAKRIWYAGYVICNSLNFSDYDFFVPDGIKEELFKSLKNNDEETLWELSRLFYGECKRKTNDFINSWEYPKDTDEALVTIANSFLKEVIFYEEK